MKCNQCGMVYSNKSGICPRCKSTAGSASMKNKGMYKTFFHIGKYPVNILQFYFLIEINLTIVFLLINLVNYFVSGLNIWWSVPASFALFCGYLLLSLISSNNKTFLPRFRRLAIHTVITCILFQVLVTKGKWCTEYFMPSFAVFCYAFIFIASIVAKGQLSQKLMTANVLSLIGITSMIMVACGYDDGNLAGQAFVLIIGIISIFVILNTVFIAVLKLKHNIGGLLE